MIEIGSDHSIRIPRGEAASFEITLQNEATGSEYSVSENDTLIFSVKKSHKDSKTLLQKKIIGLTQFDFYPEDTQNMPFGSYEYDIWLIPDGGLPKQVHKVCTFEVAKEVY